MRSSQSHDERTGKAGPAEETLRVIAGLPAPDGLVDRVQTRLRTAPRSARLLSWPMVFGPGGWVYGPAVRGAAAAAIVCVVAGGGWRIYSHVQPAASARVITMPAPASPARGFSTAGSVHTPDPRPVLTHQIETPSEKVPEASDSAARQPVPETGKKRGKSQGRATSSANSLR